MKEYIEERAVAIANYIIDYNATVRQAARKFGISKSTVYKDVAERLSQTKTLPISSSPHGGVSASRFSSRQLPTLPSPHRSQQAVPELPSDARFHPALP